MGLLCNLFMCWVFFHIVCYVFPLNIRLGWETDDKTVKYDTRERFSTGIPFVNELPIHATLRQDVETTIRSAMDHSMREKDMVFVYNYISTPNSLDYFNFIEYEEYIQYLKSELGYSTRLIIDIDEEKEIYHVFLFICWRNCKEKNFFEDLPDEWSSA